MSLLNSLFSQLVAAFSQLPFFHHGPGDQGAIDSAIIKIKIHQYTPTKIIQKTFTIYLICHNKSTNNAALSRIIVTLACFGRCRDFSIGLSFTSSRLATALITKLSYHNQSLTVNT